MEEKTERATKSSWSKKKRKKLETEGQKSSSIEDIDFRLFTKRVEEEEKKG